MKRKVKVDNEKPPKRAARIKGPPICRDDATLLKLVESKPDLFDSLPKSAHDVDRTDMFYLKAALGFTDFEVLNFKSWLRRERVTNPHPDEVSTIDTHAEEDELVNENWTTIFEESLPILTNTMYNNNVKVTAEALVQQQQFVDDLRGAAAALSPGVKAKLGLNLAVLKNTKESRDAVVKNSAKYIKYYKKNE